MGEVIPFKRKPVIEDNERCLMITFDSHANLIKVSDIEDMAYGRSSIAEYEDCERFARMLAIAVMESIDGPY